jgi:hypothetical protein
MGKTRKPKAAIGGPYLDAAFICEQLLREKDGTYSAIRMVNKITLHAMPIDKGQIVQLPLSLVISFKAGDCRDAKMFSLYVTNPSGLRSHMPLLEHRHPATFSGGDTGVIASCPLFVEYDEQGTYWIDVVMDGRRHSRVPLTLALTKDPKPPLESAVPQG